MSFLPTERIKGVRNNCCPSILFYSIPYTIFLYREELKKRDTHFMKLSEMKISLTDKLICHTIRNITKYDVLEVINIDQSMQLRKRLNIKMQKIRKLERMGVKDIDPKHISDEM